MTTKIKPSSTALRPSTDHEARASTGGRLTTSERERRKADGRLYGRACQLGDSGQLDEAKTVLSGRPDLLARLETRPEHLAEKAAAGEARRASNRYQYRPPSMEAARTETDAMILERWAREAAKRPELWRYRELLAGNPHMTRLGLEKLSHSERYALSTRGPIAMVATRRLAEASVTAKKRPK
jgi:hypothetical protein